MGSPRKSGRYPLHALGNEIRGTLIVLFNRHVIQDPGHTPPDQIERMNYHDQSERAHHGRYPLENVGGRFRTQAYRGVYSRPASESVPQNSSKPRLDLNACAARVLAWIGRFLLILTAISLLTMPVTQHLWTWDHFLRGGQDFELSTLFVLSILCLVLVLSEHGKQSVDSLFAIWRIVAFIFNHRRLVRTPMREAFLIRLAERIPRPRSSDPQPSPSDLIRPLSGHSSWTSSTEPSANRSIPAKPYEV